MPEVNMPRLSDTMEEGTITRWLKQPGDEVKKGDIIAEVETDKANMEVEAYDAGTLEQILVQEGQTAPIGQAIAIIGSGAGTPKQVQPAAARTEAQDEQAPAARAMPTRSIQAASSKVGRSITSLPAQARPAASGPEGQNGSQEDRSRAKVKASPLARRMAEEYCINLSQVQGTGPGGRIVRDDIEDFVEQQRAAPTPAQPTAPQQEVPLPVAVPAVQKVDAEISMLTSMQKTIARRLTESKQQVPHIYLTVDIRLDALLKLRTELNAGLEGRGVKLSVNDFMIKALAVALMDEPKCNVMYTPAELITFKRADVSVAVSTPTGLITPIVADANSKSLSAISNQMKDLAARARDNKLKPEEFQGGTASLSNMGMYGIKQFEAVINPPQGMIMAIGAGEKRPYVIDDALGVATVMSATGSFDHRAIDGADGAELMQAFKALVEAPLAMVA